MTRIFCEIRCGIQKGKKEMTADCTFVDKRFMGFLDKILNCSFSLPSKILNTGSQGGGDL